MKGLILVAKEVRIDSETQKHSLLSVSNTLEVPCFPGIERLFLFIKLWFMPTDGGVPGFVRLVEPGDRVIGSTDTLRFTNLFDEPMPPGFQAHVPFDPLFYRSGLHRLELIVEDQVINEQFLLIKSKV